MKKQTNLSVVFNCCNLCLPSINILKYGIKIFLAAAIFFFPFCEAFSQFIWIQKASVPATGRFDAVGFSIGKKGYIGTGLTGTTWSSPSLNDFWEWDKASDVWTQKADYGGGADYAAVGFSIGAKGYIGTGGNNAMADFWEWDQATNVWTPKANFGGMSGIRLNAAGFAIGAKGYIGTGFTNSAKSQDWWEWDQATDTWTQKANFAGTARTAAVGFSIGAKGYIGTGEDASGATQDFWEWDPNANTWTQKANFPGPARSEAVGFSIAAKGYLGTGADKTGTPLKDFWQWDQATNIWTQEPDYGGGLVKNGVGFSIGSSGYIGTGVVYYVDPNNGHIKPYHPNVFWELHDSTACEITASIYPNNTTVCIGSSASIYASGGTNYSWSTGATTAVITVTPSVTTTYTVIVSDVNGCSDVASITVPVKNCCSVSPAISSDPSPGTTLCAGQNAYITASGGLSYLWNTGSTSAFIVATLSVTATYSVTVTDASGCTGTAAITFIVDPNCTSTGISQFDADALQINIWPNPSNGMFNVQWLMANGNTPDIEIYNVFGEKVYSAEAIPINHEPLTINLSSQPKGIYFLRISDLSEQLKAEGDVVINKKIVIQK